MNLKRGYPGKRRDYSPKLLRGLWINVQGSGKWTWVSLCFRGCSLWSQSFKGAKSDLPRGQEQRYSLPGLTTQEHSQFDGFCSWHCRSDAVGGAGSSALKSSAQSRPWQPWLSRDSGSWPSLMSLQWLRTWHPCLSSSGPLPAGVEMWVCRLPSHRCGNETSLLV